MLLGHWGTTPGQNFIYAHLNRVIKQYDLDMIYISGPGHGGPAVVANTYLEGTYSEVYPHISQDEAGLRKLFLQFSFPGGIPSHASPEMPRLDPRGRRARLFAQPRVRRGVRQSRSDRRLRRRRRRGGDRAAGHGLAFEQVPRPGAPTARCCRSCTSTATRSPTRRCSRASRTKSWSSCCAATAGQPYLRRGPRAGGDARGDGRRRSTQSSTQIETIQAQARDEGIARASALADDRAAITQGLDRAEGGRRQAGRRHVPLAPGAARRTRRRIPSTSQLLEDWLRSYRPEELFDDAGPAEAGAGRAGARGRAAHGRQSARQRRPAAARPADAGLPRLRGRGADARRAWHRRHARARAASCATWSS